MRGGASRHMEIAHTETNLLNMASCIPRQKVYRPTDLFLKRKKMNPLGPRRKRLQVGPASESRAWWGLRKAR